MAITKILHIGKSGKQVSRYLGSAIRYITRDSKTGNGKYVGAINCQPDHAYDQMMDTKRLFGKNDKRQAYHLIISFEEGEIDPDRAFQFMGEFVERYLKNEYEAIYSVHTDTDHIHGHIIFNSVNKMTGMKYRYEKGDWAKYIQPLTNELCEKYGLATLSLDTELATDERAYAGWYDKRGHLSPWSDLIRKDIDLAIVNADSYDDFIRILMEKGYEIKNDNGLAVRPPGMQRYRRTKSLGDLYEANTIKKRIQMENERTYVAEHGEPRILYVRTPYRLKRAKLSGMQRKYFRKLYQTGRLRKRPYSEAWKYREDIRKFHKLQEQYLLLARYDIHSSSALSPLKHQLGEEHYRMKKESDKASRQYRKYKKCRDAYQEMQHLLPARDAYLAGDTYFKDEYERYKECEQIILDKGLTGPDIEKIIRNQSEYMSFLRKRCSDLSKDMNIIRDILKDEETERIEKIREEKREQEIEGRAART